MKNTTFLIAYLALSTNNSPKKTKCTIDQCDQGLCHVETLEGWVTIPQAKRFEEGKQFLCPVWLLTKLNLNNWKQQ